MKENKQRNLSKGIFVGIHLFLFSFNLRHINKLKIEQNYEKIKIRSRNLSQKNYYLLNERERIRRYGKISHK